MNAVIAERTTRLRTDVPQGRNKLQIIPILGQSQEEPGYRCLDAETIQAVKVTEVSEGGSVPELLVENTLDIRVFLMDGQELVGAKQNRILNTDVLVPAQAQLKIPVSCVEARRWHYTTSRFSLGKAASYAVRSGKQRRVHESLKKSGRHDADQGAVWQEVDQSLAMAACSTPTAALHDAYTSREKDLADFRGSLRLPDETVGAAVFHGSEFRGLDLFDRHTTLRYFWESLIDSYAIEWLMAAGQEKSEDSEAACKALPDILHRAAEAKWEAFDSPGEGKDYRFSSDTLTGSALIWRKRTVVHLQVFPNRADQQQGPRSFRSRIHRGYGRPSGPEPCY